MSTFATFLTNGSTYRRRRHGNLDFKQRFLRESNKYFPKPIKPKVNVNPIVNYMTNQENRNQGQEQHQQRTMRYKNCSQIVPTVGLSNLIFYDCNKNAAEKSLEESISKLEEPPLLSLETESPHDSQFFEQEVISESIEHDVYVETSRHQDWTSNDFDEFIRAPQTQTIAHRPVRDSASNARYSLLSSGIDSYRSFEMDFSLQSYDRDTDNHVTLHPDVNSFEVNLNDRSNQLENQTELSNVDSFHMNVTHQSNQEMNDLIIDSDSLNTADFGYQLNSSDWQNVSQNEDESMAKFAVSSCCDISLEEIDGQDFYTNFVPLHTSTPKARHESNDRNDHVDGEQNEFSLMTPDFIPLYASSPLAETKFRTPHDVTEEFLHITGEELFFNRQEPLNDPRDEFPFSDQQDVEDLFF